MEKVNPKVEVKERSYGTTIVEITLSNGNLFRIAASYEDIISITSIDGAIVVLPKAANQIHVTAKAD